ncbi:hypothetical protein FACS1894211_04930 [Clostridia bacterium]|nr:hypothetical protein FACS1894211_04930 [Clostridia bacterium]
MKHKVKLSLLVLLSLVLVFSLLACNPQGKGENTITVDGKSETSLALNLSESLTASGQVAVALTYVKDAAEGFETAYTKGGAAVTSGIVLAADGKLTATDGGVYKITLTMKADAEKKAEINVTVNAYRADLDALIDGSASLTQANYTTTSWTAYNTALGTAQALADTAAQADFTAAKSALQTAVGGLVNISLIKPFFTEGGIDAATYTADSLAAVEALGSQYTALAGNGTQAQVDALKATIAGLLKIDIDLTQTASVVRAYVGFIIYYNNAFEGVDYEENYELRTGTDTEEDPYVYTDKNDDCRTLIPGTRAFWAWAVGTYRMTVVARNEITETTEEKTITAGVSNTDNIRVYGQNVPRTAATAPTEANGGRATGVATGKGAYFIGPEHADKDMWATTSHGGNNQNATAIPFANFAAQNPDGTDWDGQVAAGQDFYYEFDYVSLGSKDGDQWPKLFMTAGYATSTANINANTANGIRFENIVNNNQGFLEMTAGGVWGDNFLVGDGGGDLLMMGVKIRIERRCTDTTHGEFISYVNGVEIGRRPFGTEATGVFNTSTIGTAMGNSVNRISMFTNNTALFMYNFTAGVLDPLTPPAPQE